MQRRWCRLIAALVGVGGKAVESQRVRHVLAHERFEDREAAAELSEVEFNRAERAIVDKRKTANEEPRWRQGFARNLPD